MRVIYASLGTRRLGPRGLGLRLIEKQSKSEQQRLVHTTAEDAEVCRGRTCLDHSLRSSAPSAVEFSVPMLRGLIYIGLQLSVRRSGQFAVVPATRVLDSQGALLMKPAAKWQFAVH